MHVVLGSLMDTCPVVSIRFVLDYIGISHLHKNKTNLHKKHKKYAENLLFFSYLALTRNN